MPATPVPSSTVVLVRDASSGPEVLLLVRRAKRSDPFSGASVFPGGVLDAADEDEALAPPASGFDPARAADLLGESLPEPCLRAFHVAACRELYEEAGILLARRSDGVPPPAEVLGRLAHDRAALHRGEATLRTLLEREGLVLALDGLLPLARWITPEPQPKRWDARFFLTVAPDGQTATSDEVEVEEPCWLRPADAIAAYSDGRIVLAPPTYRVLEEIAPFPSTAAAIEAVRTAGPPRPVLPVLLATAPEPTLVYPGDREYPGAAGDGLNRLVLDNGRWRSLRA